MTIFLPHWKTILASIIVHIPAHKTGKFELAPFYMVIKVYNALPTDLKQLTSKPVLNAN